jgi:hypothetical protein
MVAQEVKNLKRPRMKHLAVLHSYEPASLVNEGGQSNATFQQRRATPPHCRN